MHINNSPIQKSVSSAKEFTEADLDEFCLWLYGLYEDEIVKSE